MCAAGLALLLSALAGCDQANQEDRTLQGMYKKMVGTSPKQEVAMAFDPNDADNRRVGITKLSNRDYGLKEPYLKGYAAILRNDQEPLVRSVAARALGKAKDPAYLMDLVHALADKDPGVRVDVAVALDSLTGEGAIEALRVHAAQDPAEDVRAHAAKALRHYPRKEVQETLLGCLQDKSFTVRYQAHAALVEMTGRDAGYDPDAWTGLTIVGGASRPETARPWWDWMGVQKGAGGAAGGAAATQPGPTSRPWWDWMGTTEKKN